MKGLLHRVPDPVLRRLTSASFWLLIAYFGLAAVTVSVIGVYGRTSREQALRQATEQATQLATYRQCVGSIRPLTKLNTHLRGVNDLADVLALNNVAVIATTPRDDPQYETRRANLARLRDAQAKIAAVKALPVPTVAECKARR